MADFRKRQTGEDLGAYLKAKQAFELSQTGTTTIDLGTPSAQETKKETTSVASLGGAGTQPVSNYTGVSIVDYLKSVGQASDYASRAKLAQQYGIANYVGSGEQNTQLLNLLRGGKTITPSINTTDKYIQDPNNPTASIPNPNYGKTTTTTKEEKSPLIPYDETNKTIMTSEEGLSDEAAEARRKLIAEQAETEQQEIESLTRQQQIKNLKEELGIEEAPTAPSLVSDYELLMSGQGITDLESQMNALKQTIRDTEASLRQGLYDEEGKLKPMELIGTAQRELQRQGQEQLDTLNRRYQTILDEYNTKMNYINNVMTFTQQDYQNATVAWQNKFNQAVQLNNLYQKEVDTVVATAQANLQTIVNLATEANKSFYDLDPSLQIQIYQDELKAGLPVGTYESLLTAKPEIAEILTTTTTYDAQGNQIVSFIYKNKDGTPGVVQTVKTGGYKEPEGVGGGFSDQEKRKLEQAGLSNAPRQEQLDYLYAKGEKERTMSDKEIKNKIAESYKNEYNKEEIKITLNKLNFTQADKQRSLEILDEISKFLDNPDKYYIKDDGIYEKRKTFLGIKGGMMDIFAKDKKVYSFD